MDFADEDAVAAVIEDVQPDVIVHAGALSKPDDCEEDRDRALLINTGATGYLLEAARRCRSFFLFLSTDFIFDGVSGMYREEDAAAPVNFYGETKVKAEALVQGYEFDWSIVRTVLVYGDRKGGRHNLLTLVAEKLARGEQYAVFDDQVRTPTYVEDLAEAIRSIIASKSNGIYHVSGKDVLTPYAMAVATARHLGLDARLIQRVTAESFVHGAARPKVTGFRIDKAQRDLHYQPLSFEEGLRKTFPGKEK